MVIIDVHGEGMAHCHTVTIVYWVWGHTGF